MATSRLVKCIVQQNWKERHERITHIGGDWGKVSEAEAINYITYDTYSYHVKVGSNDVKVIVAERSGKKYLKTESDTTTADNLLSLPSCS